MKKNQIIGFAYEVVDSHCVFKALDELGILYGGEGNRHLGYTLTVPHEQAELARLAIEEIPEYQSGDLMIFLCDEPPDFKGTISNQCNGEYFSWREKCSEIRCPSYVAIGDCRKMTP